MWLLSRPSQDDFFPATNISVKISQFYIGLLYMSDEGTLKFYPAGNEHRRLKRYLLSFVGTALL